MAIYKHIMYSDVSDRCYLDVNIPDDRDEFYCFVYIHGGGLEAGGSWEPFHAPLVKLGIAVVGIQYRMYPDGAKYPDYIIDSANAIKWTFDNIGKYGKCKGIFSVARIKPASLCSVPYFAQHQVEFKTLCAVSEQPGFSLQYGNKINSF